MGGVAIATSVARDIPLSTHSSMSSVKSSVEGVSNTKVSMRSVVHALFACHVT